MIRKLFQHRESEAPYMALAEKIMLEVFSGKTLPGQKLPPIRRLAEKHGVSPNTAHRALDVLQREGIIATRRTTGKYVTADTRLILQWKYKYIALQLDSLAENLSAAGFSMLEVEREIMQRFAGRPAVAKA